MKGKWLVRVEEFCCENCRHRKFYFLKSKDGIPRRRYRTPLGQAALRARLLTDSLSEAVSFDSRDVAMEYKLRLRQAHGEHPASPSRRGRRLPEGANEGISNWYIHAQSADDPTGSVSP